jgi:hypothetical protein
VTVAEDLASGLQRLDVRASDPVLYEVARRLAADGQWKEGLDRARAGIRGGADKSRVLLALATGALEGGRPDRALKALEQVGAEAATGPGLRLHVRALVAAGDRDGARALVDRRRLDAPADPELEALAALLAPQAGARGALPLETARRVKLLLEVGEPGRALRVVRRLRFEHPDDPALADLARACAEAVEAGDRLDDVVVGLPLPELEIGLEELP